MRSSSAKFIAVVRRQNNGSSHESKQVAEMVDHSGWVREVDIVRVVGCEARNKHVATQNPGGGKGMIGNHVFLASSHSIHGSFVVHHHRAENKNNSNSVVDACQRIWMLEDRGSIQ